MILFEGLGIFVKDLSFIPTFNPSELVSFRKLVIDLLLLPENTYDRDFFLY